jgi:hypothetical protein
MISPAFSHCGHGICPWLLDYSLSLPEPKQGWFCSIVINSYKCYLVELSKSPQLSRDLPREIWGNMSKCKLGSTTATLEYWVFDPNCAFKLPTPQIPHPRASERAICVASDLRPTPPKVALKVPLARLDPTQTSLDPVQ